MVCRLRAWTIRERHGEPEDETDGRSLDYWGQADMILKTQHRAGTSALSDPEHRLQLAVLEIPYTNLDAT